MERTRKIIRTSILGIVVNVLLVMFKMTVGLMTNSIAIILDAVNNLSDALSSLITIIGTKFAGKAPDKKHPYGHGRIEYLTSSLIALLVLAAGITSLKESAAKMLHPEAAVYTVASLVIIAVAVIAKLLCGSYVRRVGREIHSGSLVASGSDAFFDAVLSFATLVAAVISMIWDISLEGILGVVISVFILRAGVQMLLETLDHIIGMRIDQSLSKQIKAAVRAYPGVYGAYDLALHNYGPNQVIGSIHIEVDDDMTARDIHRLSRRIAADMFHQFGISLTIGIYAANNRPGEFTGMKQTVCGVLKAFPDILQMHGFYVDEQRHDVLFDIVIAFGANSQQIRKNVIQKLTEIYPEYRFDIHLDVDTSD